METGIDKISIVQQALLNAKTPAQSKAVESMAAAPSIELAHAWNDIEAGPGPEDLKPHAGVRFPLLFIKKLLLLNLWKRN